MALGCLIIAGVALLNACQVVYEELTYCPQNLVVNFSADEASDCSDAEGERYVYDLSTMKYLSVGLYDAKSGRLVKKQNLQPNDILKQSLLFKNLPEGDYVISAWTAEVSIPEIYNTDTGKSFPWKTDVEAVAQYDKVLPRIFHATARHTMVAKPDSGTVDDQILLNFEPYTQNVEFKLLGLTYSKQYTLTWTFNKQDHSFGRHLKRPTEYTRTVETGTLDVAPDGTATIVLPMLKEPGENDGVLTLKGDGRDVMEPIAFSDLVEKVGRANGVHIPVECLQTVPVTLEVKHSADMAVIVTILNWNVVHRMVLFGEN